MLEIQHINNMDRPLKDIVLPISKYTASVVTSFNHAEHKSIDLVRYEGGTMKYVNGDVVMENLPMDATQRGEDITLKLGVKSLKDANGADVPVTQEVIDNLDQRDFNFLLLELLKIQSEDSENKKK